MKNKMIKPLLVFPPGWTPFGPYLALPALKGYLEQKGIPADIWDLNIDFFDYIFTPAFLKKAHESAQETLAGLNQKPELDREEEETYRKCVQAILSKNVIEEIEEEKQTIRSKNYYETGVSEKTNRVLFGALQLASCICEGLEIRFNKIRLKYDIKSTQQVLKALDDEMANPFIAYFKENVLPNIDPQTNFLGISVTSNSQLIPALTLAKLVKRECPHIRHVVLGGNLITRLAKDWKKPHPFFEFFDFLICYEGEEGLHRLIRSLEEEGNFSKVPNLCYVDENTLVKNDPFALNIADLAVPNFDGYSRKSYLLPELVLPLYSSKSCFAKCAFCTIPFATSGSYRVLPTEKIYDIMNTLSKKYQTVYFSFVDETFAAPIMKKIADKIIENNAPFQWYGETRFTPHFSESFCKNLYRGGCRKIQFGLESYNQRVLDLMKKETRVEWIEPTLTNCFKAGIAVHLFFMIGFPTETEEEALNTIRFTKRMVLLSKDKYKNPFSTRGWDTFGLDKHSAIWYFPKTYSVTIKPVTKDEDLTLQYEYQCSQGLTPQAAKALVDKYRHDPSVVLKGTDIKPFHDRSVTLYSEELPFLCICRKELPQEKPEKPVVWRRLILENRLNLKLNRHVHSLQIRRNIYSPDGKKEAKLILYNNHRQSVMILPSRFRNLIDQLKNRAVTKNTFKDKENREWLEILLTYDFAETTIEPNKETAFDWSTTLLCYDPNNVHKVSDEATKEVFLFQYVFGKVIKISYPSFLLLQKFRTPFTAEAMYKRLQETSNKLSKPVFQQFIETCLHNKVLDIDFRMKGGEYYARAEQNINTAIVA